MMKKVSTIGAVVVALLIGASLPTILRPSHAQLSAASTWIPASGVGGTGNAITLSGLAIGSLNDLLGVPVRFLPTVGTGANIAGATTVNPSGPGGALGTVVVKRLSGGSLVATAGGDFSIGVMVEVIYDGTEFVQTNPATGSEVVGSEINYTGATLPPGYLSENGICVSQTTYASLYASYGGTDLYSPGSTGGACSAGQFHVKFANGRVSVAADTQGAVTAGILTSGGSGCAATIVAVNCGGQNESIARTNLPAITFINSGIAATASSVSTPSVNYNSTGGTGSTNVALENSSGGGSGTGAPASLSVSTVTTVTVGSQGVASTGGSGTPLITVQPTSTVFMGVKY